MKRTSLCATLLCLAAIAILALAAAPAGAIIGGTPDAANSYNNVGMNMEFGWLPGLPDTYAIAASCTLVSNDPPDNVIVMMAAHQLAWNVDPMANRVTFKPLTGLEWPWPWIIPDEEISSADTYTVQDWVMHPDFDPAPYRGGLGNSKPGVIGPGREDVALMWLDREVLDPITGEPVAPAPIIGLNGLDGLTLRGETFTAVGYGLNAWLKGNATSATASGHVTAAWSGRNYADASVVNDRAAFLDRFLMLTSCVCDFDSGGAIFLGDARTIVAIPSFAHDGGSGPNYNYRLDSASAQDFLHDNGVATGQ